MERGQGIGAVQHEMPLTESSTQFKAVDTTDNGVQEVKGFAKTIKFIETALAEGAHFKVPESTSKERWERDIDITFVYLLSPEESLEDTGRIYGDITRERVRQIRNKTMRDLWLNCLPETQALFPFEELELKKPDPQKSRERKSQARGGKTIFIRDQIDSGKSIRQIQREGGLSIEQIGSSRIISRKWGTEVPYLNTPHSQNVDLERKLLAAEADQQKQALLDKVKRGFYQARTGGDDPLFLAIGGLIKEAGLKIGPSNRFFVSVKLSIKTAGVSIGEVPMKAKTNGEERTYHNYFILAKDKERAKAILLADPNLQRFRRL